MFLYDPIVGTGARGGSKLNVNDPELEDCEEACNELEECAGFDRSDSACYLHLSADNLNNQYSSAGVTLYIKTDCPIVGRKL